MPTIELTQKEIDTLNEALLTWNDYPDYWDEVKELYPKTVHTFTMGDAEDEALRQKLISDYRTFPLAAKG